MYSVSGVVIASGGAGVTLAFTGTASMMLVLVAMVMIVSGLLLVRFAALRKPRR